MFDGKIQGVHGFHDRGMGINEGLGMISMAIPGT
jgi:hypothetical protein